MKKIFGNEVIDSTKEMWGLDEEDEIRGAYRPTGHPAVIMAFRDQYPVLTELIVMVCCRRLC